MWWTGCDQRSCTGALYGRVPRRRRRRLRCRLRPTAYVDRRVPPDADGPRDAASLEVALLPALPRTAAFTGRRRRRPAPSGEVIRRRRRLRRVSRVEGDPASIAGGVVLPLSRVIHVSTGAVLPPSMARPPTAVQGDLEPPSVFSRYPG